MLRVLRDVIRVLATDIGDAPLNDVATPPQEMSMKSAIVTLLLAASLAATCAVAQEGTGSGPPRPKSIIIITSPLPATLPTTPKLVPPKFR